MTRKIDAARHPDPVAQLVQRFEDAFHGGEARGASANPEMETDVEYAAAPALGLVEQGRQRGADVSDKLVRFDKSVGMKELHVVAVEGVRDDQHSIRARRREIRQIVVQSIGII